MHAPAEPWLSPQSHGTVTSMCCALQGGTLFPVAHLAAQPFQEAFL